MVYIIEHLEPRVWNWCLIEYRHISKLVGKNNLWFTNIKRKNKNLEKIGKVIKKSVQELDLDNACILDPEAKETLTPGEAKKFKYYIFGGILGDFPPRKRTEAELTQFMPKTAKRNIGKEQFPTDNAVCVVKEIVSGKKLSDLKFQDNLDIEINEIESVTLPFRYLLVKGKPLVCPEIVSHMKHKRGF